MLVANDLAIDTRVRKIAHDVAAAGPRVIVLGFSPDAAERRLLIGRAEVRLLPVGRVLRQRTHRTPLLPTSRSALLARRLQAESARYFNRQREVGARIGWLLSDHQLSAAGHPSRRDVPDVEGVGGWVLRRVSTRWAKARQLMARRRLKGRETALRRMLGVRYRLFGLRQWWLRRRLMRAQRAEESRGGWNEVLPELHDYEAALGPVLDELRPNLIHAHDVHLLGVAARAVGRAYVGGRQTKLIYDSHEFVPGLAKTAPHLVRAWANLEREYIRRADRVITVSPQMAEAITHEYELDTLPDVVMNVPLSATSSKRSLRDEVGVGPDAPLVVYSGGVTPLRGVHTLLEAIGRLDGVHLALVTDRDRYTIDLEQVAARAGFSDRVHVVPYVDPSEVVPFLRSATVGACPFLSDPVSHQVTLTNKVFEYMHAGLPVVVSDCRATAELVAGSGIGEVFRSGDADSLVDALARVLRDLPRYRSAYTRNPDLFERYSWQVQRKTLLGAYRELLGQAFIEEPQGVVPLPPLYPIEPFEGSGTPTEAGSVLASGTATGAPIE